MDTSMMTPSGALEIFRYAKRFIIDHYYVKSQRCRECVHDADCRGLHINQVRAHGFVLAQPVRGLDSIAAQVAE
jgi:hypothetical protein